MHSGISSLRTSHDYSYGENISVKGHHQKNLKVEGKIRILNTINFKSDALCCQFSVDGSKIAVGLANGDVKMYQSQTGEPLYHLPAPASCDNNDVKEISVAVTSLHFLSPESSKKGELLVVTYSGGLMKTWHVATSTCLSKVYEDRQTLASELSPLQDYLLTGGASENIYLYDVETSSQIRSFAPRLNHSVMDGHRFRIFSIKYHPKYLNLFLSGGWDNTIQFWDTRQPHSIRYISGPHICGGDGIDVDPEYNHILTSSWRRNDVLQVWDFQSGEKIQTFKTDYHGGSMLYCGQWLGKKHVISGGSDNNMFKITDKTTLETTGVIANLTSGVYSIDHNKTQSMKDENDVTTIAIASGQQLYIATNI